MNTPSVLERKDHGEILVAKTNGEHIRFDFQDSCRPGRRGGDAAVQVIAEQI